jgi:hypothetical protein
MISSLKIKLNQTVAENFQRNWNVPLVLLGKDLDEQDSMEF